MPSTQIRCMITANRRASATIAFFIPRCLAIFIAQALSQDQDDPEEIGYEVALENPLIRGAAASPEEWPSGLRQRS